MAGWPSVSNRRKKERNQSKARQQSKGKWRQTKLACSLRYSVTMFMPLILDAASTYTPTDSRTHRYKMDSLVFPLRPKHPDTPLPEPSRPSSCRARHSTLHLLLRHSVLVLCPDIPSPLRAWMTPDSSARKLLTKVVQIFPCGQR